MGTKVYFFKDGQYIRFDRASDVTDGPDAAVAGNWPGLAEAGFDQPDAAVNFEAGKVYFFKGDSYLRYDVATDRVDADHVQCADRGRRGA